MKLSQLKEIEYLELINSIDIDRDVEDVYIGDLLSFVMAKGNEHSLWLTVQRHINVIAVAELNEFSAIVFVEGVEPDEETLLKANELHLPLFKTSLTSYALCKIFYHIGL